MCTMDFNIVDASSNCIFGSIHKVIHQIFNLQRSKLVDWVSGGLCGFSGLFAFVQSSWSDQWIPSLFCRYRVSHTAQWPKSHRHSRFVGVNLICDLLPRSHMRFSIDSWNVFVETGFGRQNGGFCDHQGAGKLGTVIIVLVSEIRRCVVRKRSFSGGGSIHYSVAQFVFPNLNRLEDIGVF
ncbi:hypothetical protein CLUG_04103 [Clavispora lusitaniae ATCC 42720]|uniref:Uncharacterized protein n=1 Tax=Clavispora lusitaniae (strain ATCC 42720) TaxID=306902 RepID=C4Y7C5_CLAL4|nr:uncharacterized protein CLUG_04103 [Clavispora lusitaniae ATCC 42720]EEQ39974.1 hypothetical protein CLUG_04103 [Clavispora lusitaniae ATCC 42720]